MKPILLVTLEYPPQIGGVAEYLKRFAESYSGGAVFVLAPPHAGAHQADMQAKAAIYRRELLGRRVRPRWLPALYWTWWLAKKERPALIVVSHVLPIGMIARIVGRALRIPYAVICHGMDIASAAAIGGYKRSQAQRVLKDAAFVVANSDFTANLATGLGASAEKTVVVRPGASFPEDSSVSHEDAADARAKFGFGSAFTLLTVGRLVARKGFSDCLKAVAKLKHQDVFVRYAIAGDGPEMAALREEAVTLGIEDRVHFLGAVSSADLATLYAACDAFVMVPKSIGPDIEGFGIVYLEAGLFGKPVIGSRSGGVPDAVVHGETGILVDPSDVPAIVDAVRRLMGDRALRERLGAAGRKRVTTELRWDRQMKTAMEAIEAFVK